MKRAVIGIGALLIIAAVGAGSFWAGMTWGNQLFGGGGRVPPQMGGEFGEFRDRFEEMAGTPQPRGEGAPFRGGTMGTIQSVEGDDLVVSTEEGEIRVQTTDTTLIEKSMTVGVEELAVGEEVTVSGSSNDDGSITARSIRVSTVP